MASSGDVAPDLPCRMSLSRLAFPFGALIGSLWQTDRQRQVYARWQNLYLAATSNGNAPHGVKGFDKAYQYRKASDSSLRLTCLPGADGEEGYPGNLQVTVVLFR